VESETIEKCGLGGTQSLLITVGTEVQQGRVGRNIWHYWKKGGKVY